jgi:acyl dehydratase
MQFREFYVGQIFHVGTHEIDELSILKFAREFDPQPFHIDKHLAEGGRWRGLIASGFHTCAIAMRLVVDNVLHDSNSCGSPGIDQIKWPTPVRPCDRLSLSIHVLEVRHSRSGNYGVVRWQWMMSNQKDQTVLDLIAISLFDLTCR